MATFDRSVSDTVTAAEYFVITSIANRPFPTVPYADEEDVRIGQSIVVPDQVFRAYEGFRNLEDALAVTDALVVPQVVLDDVRSLADGTVRVDFGSPMVSNAALANPLSYQIAPDTVGAGVTVNSVRVPEGNPVFVVLTTSEHTDGEDYDLTLVEEAFPGQLLRAVNGGTVLGSPTDAYVAIGFLPTIVRVISESSKSVRITFSETMLDNNDIRDTAQYVWDNGLTTVAVTSVSLTDVVLETSEQTEGLLYNLVIG